MKTLIYQLCVLLLLTGLTACGGGGGGSSSNDDRVYEMYVPASYDGLTATPLIVVLHGFGGDGAQILNYFRLADAAELVSKDHAPRQLHRDLVDCEGPNQHGLALGAAVATDAGNHGQIAMMR